MDRLVKTEIGKLVIPAYGETALEEMPVFAENRVHQRTSGNPYPCRVVCDVDRSRRAEREYTCVSIENDYIKIMILPELGGRIYSALDKTTGYDFFYKQHVVKPALIGCLGSWISGGVEFNWPFHHRPSTFMPVDYDIEQSDGGSATVWLSEHDPINHMKGMVGVRLNANEAMFETVVRLYNRTPVRHSFLWWENAAVPVNKSYQIFFPPDVAYVNFHYKRSVTTYPVASNSTGLYNGIYYDGETDISLHRNTERPTSYFSAPSKYDFFGGYDHSKSCGVVHVADHEVSPGKKMFTWAYSQLARSWENALTDDDGPYAELMAGSYSDNQPDFSWLEPYETKRFSQYWYPIGKIGIPIYANLNGAVHWDENGIKLQSVRALDGAAIKISGENGVIFEKTISLEAGVPCELSAPPKENGLRLTVDAENITLMDYTCCKAEEFGIPPLTQNLPKPEEVKTAQTLYLEGVHVSQYRDPLIKPDAYWKKALERDPAHIPSLLSLGDYEYRRGLFDIAEEYTEAALSELTRFNKHPESGKAYYQLGLILSAKRKSGQAYSMFRKAAWNHDYRSPALTKAAAIRGAENDYRQMEGLAAEAVIADPLNSAARVYEAAAKYKLGKTSECICALEALLALDRLDCTGRYIYMLCGKLTEDEFYRSLRGDMSQLCLDIASELLECGMEAEARRLLAGVKNPSAVVLYMLGDNGAAVKVPVNSAYPSRFIELEALTKAVKLNPDDAVAENLLGCMLYNFRRYDEAAECFSKAVSAAPEYYMPYRNLAVAYYSHLNKSGEAEALLKKALSLKRGDEQLLFEYAYVTAKNGVHPEMRIAFIKAAAEKEMRWDVCIELARAYNQSCQYRKAVELMLSHTFVPCEGGEHAVAEQYMYALHMLGKEAMKGGDYSAALKNFKEAQSLPDNLGSGIWNKVILVPHQYYEAVCAGKLGDAAGEKKIYDYICSLEIDYFSDMHLPELAYYKALCRDRLGQKLEARAIIDAAAQKWRKGLKASDEGFFSATPFFISYCDDAAKMRKAYFSYLLALAEAYMGHDEAADKYLADCLSADRYALRYLPDNVKYK